ncbi:probable G-protein coupled receptor 156 isoform X2 [Nothobranchius furzeri]|uniref:G protein-coupled receptor 156 n=4 Tax=Nothobranchius TaxID=28779 RepID=A0A1A7ZRI4_NOTFU|nr:probable G-protein coupled receptor 156 [Nothobranchius furzeri]XP_054602821.1 probable G-protein coupled receptor 156 [Nothobranchius furzeri]KAF7215681.1 transcript variant X1 [Nothobranchius furzeri]
MVDRLGPVMEHELNCSSQCNSPLCFIQSGISSHDGLDILQRLCSLTLTAELPRRPLSAVLRAVVWTLLSCGILTAVCFFLFTLRFKNNRIVKMSSPNLNYLTLFGSVLTYASGFLFAIDEQAQSQTGTSLALLQARKWTLCVGTTLVFGPILGKTWRLYRVFTQRVPDKRVIIRDIQLIGMVVLLILVDILVLTTWNLSDPIRCSRSVKAVVKVMERHVSSSLSQLSSCSSEYSTIWVIIIAVQKGCLLLYGTYLAGLTSNVSHPPVNQSPTIITAVTLVTLSSAVAVPVSIFLQAWPNLIHSTVAGAIFLCTLATNCMLFVPQLTQWRQFEEDQNNPSQMAKYFSSPSKSQTSMYSQDEIYYLLGENSSMKKLLNEKNAAIDTLQEQVNNAKEKLLRLMTASQLIEDVDGSPSQLNSCSTQTTELQSESYSPSVLSQGNIKSSLSSPRLSNRLPASPVLSNTVSSPPNSSSVQNSSASPADEDFYVRGIQRNASVSGHADRNAAQSRVDEDPKRPVSFTFPCRTAAEAVHFVTSLQNRRGLNLSQAQTFVGHSGLTLQIGPNAKLAGFVSSEKLQEILLELSLDAASGKPSKLTPPSPCSPPPPTLPHCPSLSPYAIRKRQPPFYSSRRHLSSSCFYKGSDGPTCRKTRDPNPGSSTMNETLFHVHGCNNEPEKEIEAEEGVEDEQERMKTCQRCVSRFHKYTACPCVGHNHSSQPGMDVDGDRQQRSRHIRDSSGYWDSDSSSSTDYCYFHRPFCDSCLQRGSLLSSDSSSDSSDSEFDDCTNLYHAPRPVVFKEDLKPTLV